MIAEENLSSNGNHTISISHTKVVLLIIKLMTQTAPHFKACLASKTYKKQKLNENDFTQIYVEQAQILIRQHDYPFNVNSQYSDIHKLSKGFSDFYFYPMEQGKTTASLFSVESKRLPAPEKAREKEYVIGNNNNGGIERYKTEKHGRGLNTCGLLGFIENENSQHWKAQVNGWIDELAKTNEDWKTEEMLSEKETQKECTLLKSIAYGKKGAIDLVHLWIEVK